MGANTLRGGKNAYNPAVFVSNWVEERVNPAAAYRPSGFNPTSFQTETRQRDMSCTGEGGAMFGSGIDEGTKVGFVDYSNLVNYDLRNGAGTWKAMTSSSNKAGVDATGGDFEFGVPHRPQSGMQGAALEEYREQWTVEAPGNRKTRFTTEKTLCQNACFGAETAVLRRYPNVPRVVVRLVQEVKVWAGGRKDDADAGPAFARLAELFPPGGETTLLNFTRTLRKAGLRFTKFDAEVVARHCGQLAALDGATLDYASILDTLGKIAPEATPDGTTVPAWEQKVAREQAARAAKTSAAAAKAAAGSAASTVAGFYTGGGQLNGKPIGRTTCPWDN